MGAPGIAEGLSSQSVELQRNNRICTRLRGPSYLSKQSLLKKAQPVSASLALLKSSRNKPCVPTALVVILQYFETDVACHGVEYYRAPVLVGQNLDAWFSAALRDGFSVHLLDAR